MSHPIPYSSENCPMLPSDIVFLVELITAHSKNVELVKYEDLMEEFLQKAPHQPKLDPQEVQKEIDEIPHKEKLLRNCADDSEEEKERRRLISRRRMLSSLFEGSISVSDLKEEPEEETREVNPEYFDFVLNEALKGDNGLGSLESWDKQRYYHFVPLLSSSFARIVSTKNNPYQQVLDVVRDSSRIYPRPVGVFSFEFAPFNLDPKLIKEILDQIGRDPDAKDIRVALTSAGTVYLYSSKYLEDDYADFLAEEMDQGDAEML